jgi:pilus assembly protein CpaC
MSGRATLGRSRGPARVVALAMAAWALLGALATPAPAETPPIARLMLDIGEGEQLTLPRSAEAVFVTDPEIADVQVASPTTLVIFGIKAGRTTLVATDARGQRILVRDVRVRHSVTLLDEILRERFPGNRVTLTSAPGTLMIEGQARTARESEAILATIAGVVGAQEKLIDRLTIETPTQVNLRVRVAEVSRTIDRRLGFNIQSLFEAGNFVFGLATGRDFVATAGGLAADGTGIVLPTPEYGAVLGRYQTRSVNIDALIDALDEEGLVRTLAEPNLTAVSGQTASFLAGGEFPIPVAQDGDTTTIEFRQFGVVLEFTPTVLGPDRISLLVRPEVSELSNAGAVEVQGFRIPSLTVRRVQTTVELGSGQSLVIGGLLQQDSRDLVRKVPGLGDIPVLGALFSSSSYQNNETELMVIVTPFTVRATSGAEIDTPLGRLAPLAPVERLLLDRTGQGPGRTVGARLSGPVGFVY